MTADAERLPPAAALGVVFVASLFASAVACVSLLDIALPFGCPSPWPFGMRGFVILWILAASALIAAVVAMRASRTVLGSIATFVIGSILPFPPVMGGRGQLVHASLLSGKCGKGDVYACEWAGVLYRRVGDEPSARAEDLRGCLAGRMMLCERAFSSDAEEAKRACPVVTAACAKQPLVLGEPATACQLRDTHCAR